MGPLGSPLVRVDLRKSNRGATLPVPLEWLQVARALAHASVHPTALWGGRPCKSIGLEKLWTPLRLEELRGGNSIVPRRCW